MALCININGSIDASCASINTYTISYVEHNNTNGFTPLIAETDMKIYLSYGGSTLVRGVDYTTPSSVTLLAGTSESIIQIETHTDISGIINIQTNYEIDQCSPFQINVDCDYIADEPDGPVISIDSCEEIGFFWEQYQHKTTLPNYMI